jgi:beta-1,4-mannosyl-glycoprotein beta-1,4-N-acetylglucosaminyltransferase
MYFDEDLMLELRLNILDKYIDKFVIVEATRDHAGNKKKLNFDIKNFEKFQNKIIYLIVDDIPEKVTKHKKNWSPNFVRENFNRNAITRALTECSPNDLIIISDADEIPNLEVLEKIKINKFAIFTQKEFIYKLNLLSDNSWNGSSICYKKYLKSPQWLRDKKFIRRGFLRKFFFKTQFIENGGWHFSFIKNPEDIVKKLKSYAHSEFAVFGDTNFIKRNIEMKKFFIDPNKKLKVVPVDDSFPAYIKENKEKLANWIL